MDSENSTQTRFPLFSYHGDTGELFKIYIVNFLLTIITLGIYRFWGKTRIRKYLWSHVEFQGDRLEYTGTAKELFIGFLVILFFVLIPLFGIPEIYLYISDDANLTLPAAFGTLQILIVYFLIPVAIYRARRYRLSRTQWRGIRAGQTGSAFIYALKTFAYIIVEILTLGMTVPIFRKKLNHYRLNNTWFGNSRFEFEADAGPLYGSFFGMIGLYAIMLIILITIQFAVGSAIFASLGLSLTSDTFDPAKMNEFGQAAVVPIFISLFIFALLMQAPRLWYIAAEMRYFTSKTKLNGLEFNLELSRGHYIWFVMSNEIMALFSLGLALPFVYNRYLRYFADRLTGTGDVNALLISQSELQGPTRGEGLADAFDVGGI